MNKQKYIVIAGIGILSMILSAFSRKIPLHINVPANWPAPSHDFSKYPLSAEKILLGRKLFYDPILSRDSTISCASCHSPYTAFTHIDHSVSHGIEGKLGNRNSPSLVNLAWASRFMWDGSVAHLNEQAFRPITNPVEMDEKVPHVVSKLQAGRLYPALFYAAFSDSVITGANMMEALTQFELTLVSDNSRYDSVMRGTATFNPLEAQGYELFKKNCASCHTEPLFTNEGFENNGLAEDDSLRDIGLMKVTHLSSDSLKFKVPTLRNIQYTAPYMHDGRFKTLNMVLNSYIMGLQHTPTLSPKLQKGIFFTDEQKMAVIAFLFTLTDKHFLTNPDFRESFLTAAKDSIPKSVIR